MEDPECWEIAAAALDLATTEARERARALGELTAAAQRLLGVAAGAALISDGAVHGVVSTGPEGPRAVLSAGFGQGPGGDCARSGRPVRCDDLARERHRWLAFAAKAAAAGVTGAWALPIRRDSGTLGALLMLGHGDARPDLRAAGLLTCAAATAVVHASELEHADLECRQLRAALQSRIPIEQAKGMLSAQTGLDVDAAFELLRVHARRNGRPLTELAAAVVSREIDSTALFR